MYLNAKQIFDSLPAEWTPISQCIMRLGFNLKVAGVPWTDIDQVVLACHWFARITLADSRLNPSGASHSDLLIRRCQSFDEWRVRCYR